MRLMRWMVALAAPFLLAAEAAAPAQAPAPAAPWGALNVSALREEIARTSAEAIPALDTAPLDRAIASGEPAAVALAADQLALRLAHLILTGCSTPKEKAGWAIADSDERLDVRLPLAAALAEGKLPAFFASLRPRHPDYAALRSAYAAESDPARRTQIARNMERWRWLPHDLGADYVIVNAASFEASLWRGGARIGTWKVIVGKPASPTPVFAATITGVTLNPWWDIPANIVRESVGALTRRNPKLARQRGYVWGGGHYRQRPGPSNALGLMKLAMPNPYSVYLHDTPTKNLFERDVRAFSHGCIRVGDALGFAATLLDGVHSREQIDAVLAGGKTTTVDLSRPIPVYITYFTAAVRGDGQFALMPDIYGRDGRMGDAANPAKLCAA
jgi:murein L,D-transpeptidase YcbB/YkuD